VERDSDTQFNVRVTPSSRARDVSDTLHLDALLESGVIKRSSVYVRIR
jgi:hypothetical protein